MKTILFDGRFLSLGHAGIGRYSCELLKALFPLDKKQKYILLVGPNANLDKELIKVMSERDEAVEIIETDAGHYSYKEQTKLLSTLRKVNPGLVHFPHFNHPVLFKGDYVVTIHDLTLSDYSERGNMFTRFVYEKVINSAAHNSKKILTVSDYVNRQLTKTFSLPKGKVVTTYNGIDNRFKKITNPRSLSKVEKYGLDSPYILSLGQWRSHKNLLGLVEAFSKIVEMDEKWIRSVKLAFVGKQEDKYPQLKEKIIQENLQDRVIFTGFVDDEDLPLIYNGAEIFVFPSFSEGFGLPGLEAQACGVPVVSSNKTALPEIYGEGAMYFDPQNISDMVEKISKVLSDRRLRQKLSRNGLENSKKYSWKKTAEKTLAVYREILYK